NDAEWGVIGGGVGSGRKWPILLAGLLHDDAEMIAIGKTASDCVFREDCQTIYLTENDLPNYPVRTVGEAVWGERHGGFGRNRYDRVRPRGHGRLPDLLPDRERPAELPRAQGGGGRLGRASLRLWKESVQRSRKHGLPVVLHSE